MSKAETVILMLVTFALGGMASLLLLGHPPSCDPPAGQPAPLPVGSPGPWPSHGPACVDVAWLDGWWACIPQEEAG
jgi:hypothetical protein